MADLAALRQAVADSMAGLDVRVHPRLPDQIQVPCAFVDVEGVNWETAMGRGHEQWTLLIRVLLGEINSGAAQQERDTFFGGSRDIKDAVESHMPLRDGTAAQDVFVRNAQKFDGWLYANVAYLGVEVVIDVIA